MLRALLLCFAAEVVGKFLTRSQMIVEQLEKNSAVSKGLYKINSYNVDNAMLAHNYVKMGFCASWKPSCANMEKEFAAAAEKLANDPWAGKDMAFVIADLAAAKQLGRKFGVTEIPSVKSFMTHVPSEDGKGYSVQYGEYTGELTADALYRDSIDKMNKERETYPQLDISRILGKINAYEQQKVNVLKKVDTLEAFDEAKGLHSAYEKDVVAVFYTQRDKVSKKFMPELRRLVSLFAEHDKKGVEFVAIDINQGPDGATLNGIQEAIKEDPKYEHFPNIMGAPTVVFCPANSMEFVLQQRRPSLKTLLKFIEDNASAKDTPLDDSVAADAIKEMKEKAKADKEYENLKKAEKDAGSTQQTEEPAAERNIELADDEEFDL